jgi:hypothetical protein
LHKYIFYFIVSISTTHKNKTKALNMNIDKIVKKAMIDAEISGAMGLAESTGLSKEKCYRLLSGDKTLRLVDVITALGAIG